MAFKTDLIQVIPHRKQSQILQRSEINCRSVYLIQKARCTPLIHLLKDLNRTNYAINFVSQIQSK
jgi:hypothetical protein